VVPSDPTFDGCTSARPDGCGSPRVHRPERSKVVRRVVSAASRAGRPYLRRTRKAVRRTQQRARRNVKSPVRSRDRRRRADQCNPPDRGSRTVKVGRYETREVDVGGVRRHGTPSLPTPGSPSITTLFSVPRCAGLSARYTSARSGVRATKPPAAASLMRASALCGSEWPAVSEGLERLGDRADVRFRHEGDVAGAGSRHRPL